MEPSHHVWFYTVHQLCCTWPCYPLDGLISIFMLTLNHYVGDSTILHKCWTLLQGLSGIFDASKAYSRYWLDIIYSIISYNIATFNCGAQVPPLPPQVFWDTTDGIAGRCVCLWGGGYYVELFRGEWGVTQGYPLPPTILNMVIDTVVRHWESLVEEIDGVDNSEDDATQLVVRTIRDSENWWRHTEEEHTRLKVKAASFDADLIIIYISTHNVFQCVNLPF